MNLWLVTVLTGVGPRPVGKSGLGEVGIGPAPVGEEEGDEALAAPLVGRDPPKRPAWWAIMAWWAAAACCTALH